MTRKRMKKLIARCEKPNPNGYLFSKIMRNKVSIDLLKDIFKELFSIQEN